MTVADIAAALTDALENDPAAVLCLFNIRVPCNQKFVDHPTIICDSTAGQPVVGLVGLLQCIVALTGEQDQRLAAEYRDGRIVRFVAVRDPNLPA